MPNPHVSIRYSKINPAPVSGFQNGTPLTDGAHPLQAIAFSTPNTGGANPQTDNYLATPSDCGLILPFNASSPVTYTLLNPPPFSQWCVFVQNNGAGTLTIDPGTLSIDFQKATISVGQNSGLYLATDGANYFTQRGFGNVEVDAEVPSGAMDGVNQVFQLLAAPHPALSLQLFYNGVLQIPGISFSLIGATITFLLPTILPEVSATAGDSLLAYYRK